jgi:hypothetical protein
MENNTFFTIILIFIYLKYFLSNLYANIYEFISDLLIFFIFEMQNILIFLNVFDMVLIFLLNY